MIIRKSCYLLSLLQKRQAPGNSPQHRRPTLVFESICRLPTEEQPPVYSIWTQNFRNVLTLTLSSSAPRWGVALLFIYTLFTHWFTYNNRIHVRTTEDQEHALAFASPLCLPTSRWCSGSQSHRPGLIKGLCWVPHAHSPLVQTWYSVLSLHILLSTYSLGH